jgi:rare lipoprotein A
LLGKGSHQLEVERILPADAERFNASRAQAKATGSAAPAPAPAAPPKPRAPAEMAAMLYPLPPSGSAPGAGAVAAGAVAAGAAASGGAAAAAAGAAASVATGVAADAAPVPQPLQAMPRAAPLILTPVSGTGASLSPAAVTAPAGATASGFYLQLGAYGRKENAEAVRAKLAMDGGLSGLEIVPSGDVHRLYAGPYATRQDAAQAIPGLPAAMGLKPLIIQR